MYKKIFEPLKIGNLELKNRIVMGPMGTAYADEFHAPTPKLASYYEERAKGGVGLIICEHTISQPVGYWGGHAGEIFSDNSVEKWRMVVNQVHKHGAKIAIEIGHMGRCTKPERNGGITPVAPSAVPCHHYQYMPHEMTLEEIEQFKNDYLKCVVNAYKAGFDAVQLHFTNGYFLAQWISGRTNKRTDKYGGSLEGRLRLILEIILMIRKELGYDYTLIARLGSREVNGGRYIEESKVIAKALEDAGVDILDINAGSFSEFDWEFPPYYQHQGFLLEDIEKIRKSVSIPVIAGGRIIEPRMAEQILLEDRADLVEISRGHITDPYWVKKAEAGEEELINRCIGCTRCIDEINSFTLRCSVNPFVGKEKDWEIKVSDNVKSVLVIGGGPAGLQAAVVAAKRGHKVTLVEKEKQLGGLVRFAAVPPMKWETASLISTLSNEAIKLGVDIVLGKKADLEYIKQLNPDEIIIATGSTSLIPKIPGIDGENIVSAVDVLAGRTWVGKNVAIIGGGMIGCETADYLSEYGNNIAIYEMLSEIGADMWTAIKINMFKRLKAGDVEINCSSQVKLIEDGVLIYIKDNKEFISKKYDTIIVSVGLKSDNELKNILDQAKIKATVIGDALKPLRLYEVLSSAVEATITL